MFKKLSLFIGAIIFFNVSAFAWGAIGHRIVGEIAEQNISKKTKRKITQILGYESIAISSNWADFIKSNKQYSYLNSWHYVNVPGHLNYNAFSNYLLADTTPNLYNKTLFLIHELKNNTLLPVQEKQVYLKLLIHLIGDAHQPLHIGHSEDKGGNTIKELWFRDSTNLHQVWDEKLIDFQQLSYTEYAQALLPYKNIYQAQMDTIQLQNSLWETYQLTNQVYDSTKANSRLSFDYNYSFIENLNKELLKAGLHLAAILNYIYQ